MNLLLLLSALLSALTGIVPGRSTQSCAVVERHQGAAVELYVAGRPVTLRPLQAWATLIDAAAAPLVAFTTLQRARVILLTRRRRE